MKKLMLLVVLLATRLLGANADVDPNFYIYLCFGQSNMEGNAQPESIDKSNVDSRFKMLATTDFSNPSRKMGQWYTATPPIVSPWGGLGMADYFGRTMVAALPSDVKVGVVDVAIGGIAIEGFMSDKIGDLLAKADNWQKERILAYGGDPYQRLVDMGKVAQQSGVIKGILLHQGCSNTGDPNWPNNVKKIYNNLLKDLGLQAADVPIFVGEVEYQDMGGGCSSHNTQVARIPQVIPTGHVVSAYGIPGNGVDAWHFSAAGYRTFGKRYAYEVLRVMGRETKMDPDYQMPQYLKNILTPQTFETEFIAKAHSLLTLRLKCQFADGHTEDLTKETTFSSNDYAITDGKVRLGNDGTAGTVTAVYTDFFGETHNLTLTVATPGSVVRTLEKLNSLEEIKNQHLVIWNEEENKVFYCVKDKELGYDTAETVLAQSNIVGYQFKPVPLSGKQGCFFLRHITLDGADYKVGGETSGFLNTQPVTGSCCYIYGTSNQDVKNGAQWEIAYVDGQGFSIKNVGTGKYLHDATPAKYDDPVYFQFCTLKKSFTDIKTIHVDRVWDDAVYTLDGRRVNKDTLKPGIYIWNGKKYKK